MKFSDFEIDSAILTAIEKMGFETPSPIQEKTLPEVLAGRDVIGLAETGSGKTAACAIPVCQRVRSDDPKIQALIVVPTRELALQYAVETQKIGGEKGVKAYALYGGEALGLQQAKLKSGVQVLVATPGRLIDFIHNRYIELDAVETLILDEADEMLSMGFSEDLEFIINCLVHDHQTLLFSATMPKQIKLIAHNYMKDPVEIVLTQQHRVPQNLDHLFAFCDRRGERLNRLAALIEDARPKQSLIFCNSRLQVEEACRFLKQKMSQVDFLHGGQNQNLRTTITGKFRSGRIRHLVATDVAARGLDFSGVTHVFNYQFPTELDTYIHRSGRTGRSGREGVAISLVTRRDLPLLNDLLRRLKREARWLGPSPTSNASQDKGTG